jgi:hypothetical protein
MRDHLLQWQWQLYPGAHRDRRNLAIHIVTAPLFIAGALGLFASPFIGFVWAIPSLALLVAALAAQGRGHKLEREPPAPFLGPGDVAARFFAEQFFTFPRYVLTGGFARAWRKEGP